VRAFPALADTSLLAGWLGLLRFLPAVLIA
jgi:hypothetical protein